MDVDRRSRPGHNAIATMAEPLNPEGLLR